MYGTVFLGGKEFSRRRMEQLLAKEKIEVQTLNKGREYSGEYGWLAEWRDDEEEKRLQEIARRMLMEAANNHTVKSKFARSDRTRERKPLCTYRRI